MHPVHAGLTRASAWAAHAASPGLTWATLVAIAFTLLVLLLGFGLALIAVRRLGGRDGDDDGGWWPGGGGPRRPGPDGHDSPPGDPAWWTEFERQFAAYVAMRESRLR